MQRSTDLPRMVSRRSLLKSIALSLGGLFVPTTLTTSARPASSRPQAEIMVCGEPMQQVLDLAITAEALALTCYYQGVMAQDGFFRRLSNEVQLALRAMLAEEQAHYDLLQSQGANPLATTFVFPAKNFGFDDLARFLATTHTIETLLIDLYLVAARRFSELEHGDLAALCGQIAGIEAEHRVINREISLAPPDPRNDLCFERASFTCLSTAQAALASFLSGTGDAVALPDAAAIAAALNGVGCATIAPVPPAACSDSSAALLNAAAVAEALGITFYEGVVRASFFAADDQRQWYLQAALDEERQHLAFLLANGAATPPMQFFFPAATFEHLASCIDLLDRLENLFIGAYLVAMQQFSRLGLPLLAQQVGQIIGIEAEHRALGRVIAEQQPAHERCLARADYSCLADVIGAIEPFVAGSAGYTLAAPMPNDQAISAAIGRFGCTSIPLASTPPQLIYLPTIIR